MVEGEELVSGKGISFRLQYFLEFVGIVGISFAVHNQHGVMIGMSDASHNLWRNDRHWATIWEFEVMEVRSEVTLRELEF